MPLRWPLERYCSGIERVPHNPLHLYRRGSHFFAREYKKVKSSFAGCGFLEGPSSL